MPPVEFKSTSKNFPGLPDNQLHHGDTFFIKII